MHALMEVRMRRKRKPTGTLPEMREEDQDVRDDRIERCPIVLKRGETGGEVCQINHVIYYVIPLTIVANSRVIILDYRFYSQWEGIGIELLSLAEKKGRYKFGDWDFPVGEVLNDRFENGFRLNFRGDMLKGCIIGHGGLYPDDYGTTRAVSVDVTLVDSLDRINTVQGIKLPVVQGYGRRSR